MHCKTENPNCWQDIKSKLLNDIIEQVEVGHRCNKNMPVEVYTIKELRKHLESGQCPLYSLKCFCGHLDKFSLEGLKTHLREDC